MATSTGTPGASVLLRGLRITACGAFGRIYTHDYLAETVRKHGGEWCSNITPQVTHILTSPAEVSRGGSRVWTALKSNPAVVVVKLSWLLESLIKGSLELEEGHYIVMPRVYMRGRMAENIKALRVVGMAPGYGGALGKEYVVVADVVLAAVESSVEAEKAYEERTKDGPSALGKMAMKPLPVMETTLVNDFWRIQVLRGKAADPLQTSVATDHPATVPGGAIANIPAAAPTHGAQLQLTSSGVGTGVTAASGSHTPTYAVWQSWGQIPRPSTHPVGSEGSSTSGPSSSWVPPAAVRLTRDLTQEEAFDLASDIWRGCETKHGYKVIDRDFSPYFFHCCRALEALFGLLQMKYRKSKSPASIRSAGSTPATTVGTLAPYNEFMPFGPLSKGVLQRALDILKNLVRELDKVPFGLPPGDELLAKLVKLQSEYHTLVPQSFGVGLQGKLARAPFLSRVIVLSHIQRVEELLGTNADASSSSSVRVEVSGLSISYSCNCPKSLDKLLLRTLEALSTSGDEYSEIAAYFYNTLYMWEGKVTIVHIFRIDRQGEAERWAAAMKGKWKGVHDNRSMLWHGSIVGNFQSILKGGLKIVKMSEIFFSDTAAKSLGYTRGEETKLFLLCEVQLGQRSKDFRTVGSMNFSWKDASAIHPDLTGAKMPITSTPGALPRYWISSEYAVKHPNQIRHRYLLMVKDL